MEEKTKVLIFDKKEVILIFTCFLIMGLISFSLGVKIGRNYALQKSGITPHDVKAIELKSIEEEMAAKAIQEQSHQNVADAKTSTHGHSESSDHEGKSAHNEHSEHNEHGDSVSHQDGHQEDHNGEQGLQGHQENAENSDSHHDDGHGTKEGKKELILAHGGHEANHGHGKDGKGGKDGEEQYKVLEEEFHNLDRDIKNRGDKGAARSRETIQMREENLSESSSSSSHERERTKFGGVAHSHQNELDADHAGKGPSDPYQGKYTIQLGSYQLESDAAKFADGFKVRGYAPIINEVKIEGKGMWYRVSLGVFNSMTEAKEYIHKEESLFQGQDYVIAEFY